MYFLCLSANWQPGAESAESAQKRGRKEESWVSRLKPAKETEPGELYIAQGGHRWMELQARSEKEKDLCSVQTKGQKKNHQSGRAALQWRRQLFIQRRNGQVRRAERVIRGPSADLRCHALEAPNQSCPPGGHTKGPLPARPASSARTRH